MKRFAACCALLLSLSVPAAAGTLTVAVAASVQYAFSELADTFSKTTGHKIRPVYNSSGKITAQVIHGAPFDVFLSADMEYPEKLDSDGHTAASPKVYANGALVLWTLNDLDLADWPTLLSSAKIRKVAIANPKVAPYGRETIRALTHFNLEAVLRPKLVYGESIAQTNQYIHSRSVDVGFTAKAVVMAPEMRGQGKWVEVPTEAYQPIAQGIVVLKHGQRNNPQLAKQFHDFVLSVEGRSILQRYGYLLP